MKSILSFPVLEQQSVIRSSFNEFSSAKAWYTVGGSKYPLMKVTQSLARVLLTLLSKHYPVVSHIYHCLTEDRSNRGNGRGIQKRKLLPCLKEKS